MIIVTQMKQACMRQAATLAERSADEWKLASAARSGSSGDSSFSAVMYLFSSSASRCVARSACSSRGAEHGEWRSV